MRRLVVFYLIALGMVIGYFILKSFFPQESSLELRHFDTPERTASQGTEEKTETDPKKHQPQPKLMLLPQKQ